MASTLFVGCREERGKERRDFAWALRSDAVLPRSLAGQRKERKRRFFPKRRFEEGLLLDDPSKVRCGKGEGMAKKKPIVALLRPPPTGRGPLERRRREEET